MIGVLSRLRRQFDKQHSTGTSKYRTRRPTMRFSHQPVDAYSPIQTLHVITLLLPKPRLPCRLSAIEIRGYKRLRAVPYTAFLYSPSLLFDSPLLSRPHSRALPSTNRPYFTLASLHIPLVLSLHFPYFPAPTFPLSPCICL